MQSNIIKKNRIIVFILVLFLLIIVTEVFYARMKAATEAEKQNTLHETTVQNSMILEKTIENKKNVLISISNLIQSDFDIQLQGFGEMVKSMLKLYNFKRIGFVGNSGDAYTTDGTISDVSFQDNIRRGFQGKTEITGLLEDTIGGEEKVNIFSVPVFEKDGAEVMGVLFAVCSTDEIRKLLTVESFSGKGFCLVIKQDGMVIVDAPAFSLPEQSNFFDVIRSDDGENNEVIEELRQEMGVGDSGYGRLVLDGKEYFYVSMPVHVPLEDYWHMITLVPVNELTREVTPLIMEMNKLFGILVIILILVVFIYAYTFRGSQKDLLKIAYQDNLTGGANYACFKRDIRFKKNVLGYIISMDLSDFKIINNTCGIEKGNETLQNIWRIIKSNIREDELAAHINADNFVLFMIEENRQILVERLNRISREIYNLIDDLSIPHVEAYYGIYYTSNMEDAETSYSHASQAKHMVKGRRDKEYCFYDEVDFTHEIENKEMADAFEYAVLKREFEVWYQPKYGAVNEEIVGAEALVRWRRNGKLIPPGKFIPLFEQNGMISILDEYVFETVCEHQKKWQDEGIGILPVSVNISRASLYFLNIVKKYRNIQKKYGLDTKYIQFEITESATVDNDEIAGLIEEFHNAGFKLLLDDFGAGYSSISTLNKLPFDVMKVDKSLIDFIGDENGEKLLHYTIRLGQSLGLSITAEGVENEKQVLFLKDLECDDIQGYYFSKPLEAQHYKLLLEKKMYEL